METPAKKLFSCTLFGKCGLLIVYKKLIKARNNMEKLFQNEVMVCWRVL